MRNRALILLLAAAAAAPGCRGRTARDPRLERYEQLRAELRQRAALDPAVKQLGAQPGEIVVGMRSGHLGNLIRTVVRDYFDRVELDLAPDLHVHHRAEISKRTLLGTFTAGEWRIDLDLHGVRGALRAGAPVLDVRAVDRIGVDLPVTLQEARGWATVRFSWDARLLASVACRDFTIEETIEGRILPRRYRIGGTVAVAAKSGALLAQPDFPSTKFRLRIELSEGSWDRLKSRLAEQDVVSRCGLVLNPSEVVDKLAGRLREGFDVKMPRSLIVPLRLPASIERDVTVRGRRLRLAVVPRAFHVTDELTWYAVGVSASTGDTADGEARE